MFFEFSPTQDFYKVYQDVNKSARVPFGKYAIDFSEMNLDLFCETLEFTETVQDGYVFIDFEENSIKQLYHNFNREIVNILYRQILEACRQWSNNPLFDTNSTKQKCIEEIKILQANLHNYFNTGSKSAFIPNDQPFTAYFGIDEETGDFYTTYSIEYIHSLIYLELINLSNKNLRIRPCENCGHYFLPSKRSDEIYCDRIFKNIKTCKDVGYAEKEKKDPIKNLYTTARKTQHARIRYNSHIPDYKEKHFEPWKKAAEEARDKFQKTNNVEGFKKWIEENKNKY